MTMLPDMRLDLGQEFELRGQKPATRFAEAHLRGRQAALAAQLLLEVFS